MCDYSLQNTLSRPAKVGDKLTTRDFRCGTRGFAAQENSAMAVCVLPEIARMLNPSIPFQFGGTSLLIIVVGVMDFVAQAKSHVMSHQYEGLLKKSSLRGIGGKK